MKKILCMSVILPIIILIGTGRTLPAQDETSIQANPVESILSKVKIALNGYKEPFTLIVDVKAKPGKGNIAAKLYADHAAKSRLEEGIKAFEVVYDINDPDKLLLYEVYKNYSSFEHHVYAQQTQDFIVQTNNIINSRSSRLMIDVTHPKYE